MKTAADTSLPMCLSVSEFCKNPTKYIRFVSESDAALVIIRSSKPVAVLSKLAGRAAVAASDAGRGGA